ncbi:MAG: hypothetical protein ACKVP7_17085 [Hyphomicrobiaceae bacterium]
MPAKPAVRRRGTTARGTGAALLALLLTSSPTLAQSCDAPPLRIELTGYNANIETSPKPSTVKPGQLVEFNAEAIADHAVYLKAIAAKGGIPEWYWVGANCNKGPDCDRLSKAKVPLGSTGTAEWNKTESRIDDLAHAATVERAEEEMLRALKAAAAAQSHLVFRIDNMHDLDDDRFYDRRHSRGYTELRTMTDAWARIENKLRASGELQPSQITGLSAHNNFAFWKRVLAEKGKPPIVLRIENPTQFEPALVDGLDIMASHQIPLIAIEFESGHLYKPTPQALQKVMSRVSLLILMANEDNYIGGQQRFGPGPRTLVWRALGETCGTAPPPPKK